MARIQNSTQAPLHSHFQGQKRPASAQPQGDGIGTMTQDKVKDIAAAIQGLAIADRQRAVEAGQIEQKLLGGKIDTFA